MIENLFIFFVSFFLVIKGATLATRYSALLAESFRLSKYTVGFIIVAVISILPEALISFNAAIEGIPSFGLGMLFGSNIADLTLVFAIIIFVAGRRLKIESKILKSHAVYPFILLLPLILGFNGHFSRMDGLALLVAGSVFYYLALRGEVDSNIPINKDFSRAKSISFLLFSMALLIIGSYFVVDSATALANSAGISPVLIGMLIVGLGTTMPEMFFAIHSVKKNDDSLAVGDILGTVLADATILVGILALINPFAFPQKIIYITGVFMVVASFILFHFMRTGRSVSKKEAYLLFIFWLIFVVVEFMANT